MPTMKMTKTAVEKLPAPDPSGRQTLYWAEGTATPGLGILVSGVSATKSWVCQGNLPNGKSRRLTLGPVAVLSLDEAWEVAKPKLAAMLQGKDPKLTVSERMVAGMTVREVFDDLLKASSNFAPNTISIYRHAAKHLGPLLDRTMRDITPDDVEQRFTQIPLDIATRREKGLIKGGVNVTGKATANEAMRMLGTLWEFQSERDSGLGANPVRGRRFKRAWHDLERRKRQVPHDRLAEFYAAVCKLPSDIQRDLVLCGLFTGMRENEIAGLRWDEVDFTNRMLRLPASRMKGRKPFDLPMNDVVHRILVTRRAIGREGEFVFPGYRRGQWCKSYDFALSQIGEATGIKVSPHDLRRTFLNVVEGAEVSPLTHKMLVAHSAGSDVTSGYKSLSLADFRAAVQKVADRMKMLCGVEEIVSMADNVVKISA